MAIEKYYKLSDISKQTTLSKSSLLNYIHKGELKATMIGNKWLVSERNFDAFFEKIKN